MWKAEYAPKFHFKSKVRVIIGTVICRLVRLDFPTIFNLPQSLQPVR